MLISSWKEVIAMKLSGKRLIALVAATVLVCTAFSGCHKKIEYDSAPDSAYQYKVDEASKTATITAFEGDYTISNIPMTVKGMEVTEIAKGAFKDCTQLNTVNLPRTIKKINAGAFTGCVNVENLSLPYGIEEIDDEAFNGCTALKTVTLPGSITRIGNKAFFGCAALENIAFPDNSVDIGADAFANTAWIQGQSAEYLIKCNTLLRYSGSKKDIVIPEGVEIISTAFAGRTDITSVQIPKTAQRITRNAFQGCTGLTAVEIGNAVNEIGDFAFSGCTGLVAVIIPDSVSKMGTYAFSECTSLESVKIGKKLMKIPAYAFQNCTALTEVSIPKKATVDKMAFDGCVNYKG